jgi:hypothetical protein
MSAGQDFASIRSRTAVKVISAVPPQSFNPTALRPFEGRLVVLSPEQLRLHCALEDLGWTGGLDEFNDATRLTTQSCNRADSYHDEWDDSRWLWALAVSGARG